MLIRGLTEVEGIEPPYVAPDVTRHGWHVFVMTYNADAFKGLPKETFHRALEAEGIPNGGYTYPLYDNPMFNKGTGEVAGAQGRCRVMPCPVSEWACGDGVFNIAQSVLLDDADGMNDIVTAMEKVKANADALLEWKE